MSDNGQQQHQETPDALKIKAEHRQLMARQEAELDAQRLHGLPFAARMYFDPVLFDRMNLMAERMSGSRGMPKHIQGDTIMALYCIERGWSWGMSPLAVAMGTFKIGEAIGHYGRTIIAAINNSGRLNEALKFDHFADGAGSWDKVTANFREMESKKKQDEHGNPAKYLVPAYTRADEVGLGVKVSGHIRGEAEPRVLKFYLKQAWPRNSTLWATDPARQLVYTAARAFGNMYMPEIVAGARTEDDFEPPMRDITPEEERRDRPRQPLAPPIYIEAYSAHGEQYMLQAAELPGWLAEHVTVATDDELEALIAANDSTRVLEAANAEMRERLAARSAPSPRSEDRSKAGAREMGEVVEDARQSPVEPRQSPADPPSPADGQEPPPREGNGKPVTICLLDGSEISGPTAEVMPKLQAEFERVTSEEGYFKLCDDNASVIKRSAKARSWRDAAGERIGIPIDDSGDLEGGQSDLGLGR